MINLSAPMFSRTVFSPMSDYAFGQSDLRDCAAPIRPADDRIAAVGAHAAA